MCTAEPLPVLEFTEALKDSPRFRQGIGIHERYFERLDGKLNELLRLLGTMTEHGNHYVNTFYTLSVLVKQLCAESLPQDPITVATLASLSDAYAQVVHLHRAFIEQSHAAVFNNVSSLIKNELSKLTETRSHFESLSGSLDEALNRKAGVQRGRGPELADARNSLTAIGTCFAHTSLDYVAQINIAHAHKDHFILDALWSFVKECSCFFSRGHAFFDEWTAIENGCVSDAVSTLAMKCRHVERKMQDRHSLVPKEVFMHPTGISPEEDVVMEGYLFKRATNAFKTWHRRWFQIRDNQLLYSHRSVEFENPTVMESDLKLCLVRPAPGSVERACCFELVTPTKSHLLQADSETLCNAWMRALQRTIHHLHENEDGVPLRGPPSGGGSTEREHNTEPSSFAPESLLTELRRVPGNEFCADCGADSPKWASINLGVLLCIECCGIHRSFGVQVSKVRSLTMDSIEPEQRKLMATLGNRVVNSIYLAHLPSSDIVPPPPKPTSARPVREAWIKAKYVERRFSRKESERARNSAQLRAEGRKGSITAHSPLRSSSAQNLGMDRHRCPSEPLLSGAVGDSLENALNGGTTSDSDAAPVFRDSLSSPANGDVVRISACGSDTNLVSSQEALEPCRFSIGTSGSGHSGSRVLDAAASGDVTALCRLVAEGVDVNATLSDTTALHVAVKNGKGVTAEFLMLNGSKVNALDGALNTPLHIAASRGFTLIVCQLMKRGADQRLQNHSGETALELAVDGKHADIVTLLRLQEMRNEFSEEFNNPMDETVDDVMQDISRRVDSTMQ